MLLLHILGSWAPRLPASVPPRHPRQLLQPAPRQCSWPFGPLSLHAGWARGPSLLQSHGPCGCGALHTEGDKALAEFLSDEIQEGKKIKKRKSHPKMCGGWELQVNGTEAKGVRKVAGEQVTVTCDINNSIYPHSVGRRCSHKSRRLKRQSLNGCQHPVLWLKL